jgi:hypothetical protein
MPRLTAYTFHYHPLTVVSLRDEELEALRAARGNDVRVHVTEPLRLNMTFDPHRRSLGLLNYATRLDIEAVQWGNGRSDPILVVQNAQLCERLLEPDRHWEDVHRTVLGMVSELIVGVSRHRHPAYVMERAAIDPAVLADLQVRASTPLQVNRLPRHRSYVSADELSSAVAAPTQR